MVDYLLLPILNGKNDNLQFCARALLSRRSIVGLASSLLCSGNLQQDSLTIVVLASQALLLQLSRPFVSTHACKSEDNL